MSIRSLTYQQSVFNRYLSDKHFSVFYLVLRCITLLYFAIRLESRKSANKRIYLSIYLQDGNKNQLA